ncbi:MAG: hypothetical protein V1907_01160 [Candidatus Kerfeldbacteria bacterium]
MAENEPHQERDPAPEPSRVERFLTAVEQKTTSAVNLRLLRACKTSTPGSAMEEELNKVIKELLNET